MMKNHFIYVMHFTVNHYCCLVAYGSDAGISLRDTVRMKSATQRVLHSDTTKNTEKKVLVGKFSLSYITSF